MFDRAPGTRPALPRARKYCYRWTEEAHDEVLARLLALNGERAALQSPPGGGKRSARKPRPEAAPNSFVTYDSAR